MKKLSKLFTLMFATAVAFSSCSKDSNDDPTPTPDPTPTGNTIHLIGQIVKTVDHQGQPVSKTTGSFYSKNGDEVVNLVDKHNRNVVAMGMCKDKDGNIIIVANRPLSGSGEQAVVLRNLQDVTTEFIDEDQLESSYLRAVCLDPDGNIVIAGFNHNKPGVWVGSSKKFVAANWKDHAGYAYNIRNVECKGGHLYIFGYKEEAESFNHKPFVFRDQEEEINLHHAGAYENSPALGGSITEGGKLIVGGVGSPAPNVVLPAVWSDFTSAPALFDIQIEKCNAGEVLGVYTDAEDRYALVTETDTVSHNKQGKGGTYIIKNGEVQKETMLVSEEIGGVESATRMIIFNGQSYRVGSSFTAAKGVKPVYWIGNERHAIKVDDTVTAVGMGIIVE